MNLLEKSYFRYQIVANDNQNRFDFTKSFFELDWYDVTKLDHYAEIFGIGPSKSGSSRARNLWYQLCYVYDKREQ